MTRRPPAFTPSRGDWHPRHGEWHRATPTSDHEFRSHECRNGPHTCDGFYGTDGSAFGHDTYPCLCACHKTKRPAPGRRRGSTGTTGAAAGDAAAAR